jgi:hypothetical protein
MTSCCCRLTQLARKVSINCHGCRMNFIVVSVVRKTRNDHCLRVHFLACLMLG